MAIVISGVNNNDKITASDGTIDLLSGVNYTGILTAPAFTTPGNLTAGHLNIGSGIQLGNAGVATATTFVGNLTGNVNATSNLLLQIGGSEKFRVASSGQLGIGGANYGTSGQVLTSGGSGSAATWSTITGTTINSNADNRIITGSGTANTLNGESSLTYDALELHVNNASPKLKLTDTDNGGVVHLKNVGGAGILTTTDAMIFETAGSEKFRVKTDGIKVTSANAHGSSIQMYNTDSSSNVWYVNGEGNSFIGHTYPRTDANLDLGFHTGYRWRDVVLSGGIRFGSSSADDYLDDYEEGTYTPTINVGTFTTFLTHRYIKIGRLVHLHGGLIFHNNSSGTRVEISNIPFAQQTGQQFVGNVWLRRTSTGERNWNMILGEAGTNIMGIFRDSNGNDMGGHLSYSDFQHSSTYFNYSITYISAS